MNKVTLASALALLAFAFPAPAQAETINCTPITALPFTINAPGAYCLTGHLSTNIVSGEAITIAASNVILDLNGFTIDGYAGGGRTKALGIFTSRRTNITVKNGAVRGFHAGIYFSDAIPSKDSHGHVIEDIRVEDSSIVGIHFIGANSTLRNNQVVKTHGLAQPDPGARSDGIYASGSGMRILNNDVIDIVSQGPMFVNGIRVEQAPFSVVMGNRVSKVVASQFGQSHGIFMDLTRGALVSDNRISGVEWGIYFVSSLDGKYMNNMTIDAIPPYHGGAAAGMTNY